jgi:hypothetical protein
VQTYRTTVSVRSFDSSYHGSSFQGSSYPQRNYRYSDNGCSLENEEGESAPLMINGHGDDTSQELGGKFMEAGVGDECLSASLRSRGLDGIASRGESLLDWALKEANAEHSSNPSVSQGTGQVQSVSRRLSDPEPPLEGAGIPPVLGRVRGESILSAGSASSINRRISDGGFEDDADGIRTQQAGSVPRSDGGAGRGTAGSRDGQDQAASSAKGGEGNSEI